MARFSEILRMMIEIAGVICGLLAVTIPLWFASAAFGTKWEFWDWHTGLEAMSRAWGFRLLLAGLVAGALALSFMLIHRLTASRWHGSLVGVVMVVLVSAGGIGWTLQLDRQLAAAPAILDITTDFDDPPYFSTAFRSRRSESDSSLVYAGKIAENGEALASLQAQVYPEILPLHWPEPVDLTFDRALEIARVQGWRIGTASREAGMFEAGAEGLWFGFRDDMVVRIRPDEAGGSRVDVRSLARQPAHDLGRNARRVESFLNAFADVES